MFKTNDVYAVADSEMKQFIENVNAVEDVEISKIKKMSFVEKMIHGLDVNATFYRVTVKTWTLMKNSSMRKALESVGM